MRLALIGCGPAAREDVLPALKRLGLKPAVFIDPDPSAARALAGAAPIATSVGSALDRFDAAILTAPLASTPDDLAALEHAGKPALCDPHTLASAAVRSGAVLAGPFAGSRFRFADAALKAHAALASIGRIKAFEARLGGPLPPAASSAAYWDRAIAGGGALIDPGADAFDLLAWWLGPLTPIGLIDDGQGGVEAEATARLASGAGVLGTVEVSRMRTLGSSITIIGETGRFTFDLAAHAGEHLHDRRIKAWLGGGDLPASNAAEVIAGCYARREALVHDWERPAPGAAPARTLEGRKVLVTGGTGFIGARLVEKLCAEEGAEVTVAVRSFRRVARIARFPVRLRRADLSVAAEAEAVVAGQDVVFSLAYDFRRTGASNVSVHRALADACTRQGVRRFVHVSSIAVYDGWPKADLDEGSPRQGTAWEYKAAKVAIEADLTVRADDGSLSPIAVQPTIVYGPFSGQWTDQSVQQLMAGTVFLPDGGRGRCNGVYVDDVADAMIAAAASADHAGKAYIVSGPRPFAWASLFKGYAEAVGRPQALAFEAAPPPATTAPRPSLLANPMVRQLLTLLRDRLGDDRIERLREAIARLRPSRGPGVFRPAAGNPDLYLSQGVCSIEGARRDLGFTPRFGLEEGLKRTQSYIRWRYRVGA